MACISLAKWITPKPIPQLTAGKDRPPGDSHSPADPLKKETHMTEKKKDPKPFTPNQKAMLRCRGLDPNNYTFVKETYGSIYIRDKRFGAVKIINKCN